MSDDKANENKSSSTEDAKPDKKPAKATPKKQETKESLVLRSALERVDLLERAVAKLAYFTGYQNILKEFNIKPYELEKQKSKFD